VQVGEQAMADRYTYLPLVGLFIAVVWGATDLAATLRLPKPVPAAVAAAVVVALGAAAFVQTGYWRTSETLYRHAIAVTPRNHIAHDSLGNVFLNDRTVNRIDEAIDEFTAAIADNDKYVLAYSNLSHALFLQNRPQEAEAVARHALDIDPMDLRACHNLSMALYKQGRLEEAAETLRDAAGLAPGAAAIHNDLGKVLLDLSEKGSPAAVLDESIDQLRTALACQPIFPMAWRNLAKALLARGRPGDFEEAVSNAELAVAVEPGNPDNQKVLDRAKSGRRSAPAPSINYKH
jgi:protein O-mannosyl-transferase